MGIKYRYSGSDWIQTDGDDYSVERLPGGCPTSYRVSFICDVFFAKINGSGEFYDPLIAPRQYTVTTPGNILGLDNPRNLLQDQKYFQLNNQDTEYVYEFYYFWIWQTGNKGRGSIPLSGQRKSLSGRNWIGIIENSVRDLVISRADGQPDDCGDCLFKIFKNGQLIHEEVRAQCPDVRDGEGCPEGTCEVECGNTICCYRSDGISVFNFPKS